MEFQQQGGTLFIPDGRSRAAALGRTTHLGIGAHHDDLEIMALHGIVECHGRDDRWFGGVTCTDGAGCPRAGAFASYSDADMIAVRRLEQEEAARIGQYAFVAQLGWPSASIKGVTNPDFREDLRRLMESIRPQMVYTHNPADKHDTHVAVVKAVVDALRALPREHRPRRLLGCEVWRDLDWLQDDDKVVLDVSGHGDLAHRLTAAFKSQIGGGKRYDLAAEGRRRAHATFLQSHEADKMTEVCFAIDLTPLIQDEDLDLLVFTLERIDRFRDDVEKRLRGA